MTASPRAAWKRQVTIGTWHPGPGWGTPAARRRHKWPREGTPQTRFWSGIDTRTGLQQGS